MGGIGAKVLSVVFFPLFIPVYGAFLLFGLDYFSFYPSIYIWSAHIAVFTLGTMVPLLCILILYKLKVISSINMPNRRERFIPYLFTLISYIVCAFALYRLAMPKFVYSLMIAIAVALFINSIINIWWKISAHAAGVGGLLGGILYVGYQLYINPSEWIIAATLVCGMVAAARLHLNAHTPAQVVAGFLNGVVCTIIIPGFSFGWLFF